MRITIAQLNPIVGDVTGNLALIEAAMQQARSDDSEVLVTNELALIGYPPRDLLLREGMVDACEKAVQRIAATAGDLWVLVGHPRASTGGTRPLRNSVSICHAGKVVATYDKRLLPGYDVFDEDRYFEPGDEALVLDIAGVKCGVVICEDLWRADDVTADRRYPIEPVAEVAKQKAQIIFSLNASPFVLGKWQKHLRQLSEIATEHRLPIVAVNQVGANDDLTFDGRSVVIATSGQVAHVCAGFASETKTLDVEIGALKEVSKSAADAKLIKASAVIEEWSHPPCEIFHALVLGIRDYCHKTGHRALLLGLSGGIDSALVAALAAKAVGPEHVHGLMMPSCHSSDGSIDDSVDLATRLNLGSLQEISIARLHDTMRGVLKNALGIRPAELTDENVQARMRGIVLMAMSNDVGGLVLATSNKSEMAVGYSTLYGDMCGALAPVADLTKTRIYELARWINTNFNECGYSQPPIPKNSIDKAPSAELRPDQTDQDTLPPYDVLDQIIERRIELEQSEATIIAESGIDAAIVRKSLGMIDRAQFKRDQAPVVLKVTGRAFGRGRPMPIVMRERTMIEGTGTGAKASGGENLSNAKARLAAAADNGQNPKSKSPSKSQLKSKAGDAKPATNRKSAAKRDKAKADL